MAGLRANTDVLVDKLFSCKIVHVLGSVIAAHESRDRIFVPAAATNSIFLTLLGNLNDLVELRADDGGDGLEDLGERHRGTVLSSFLEVDLAGAVRLLVDDDIIKFLDGLL